MSKTLSKIDIVKSISQKTNFSQHNVSLILDKFFEELKQEMIEDNFVTIKNFGRFKLYRYLNLNKKVCYQIKIKKSRSGWKYESKKIQTNSN